MDSDKTAVITVGTSVDVTERRPNDSGTLRLKITQGWVSEKTGAGALCFHLISEPAPINAPAPQVYALSASRPPTAFRCVKKSQIRAGFEMDSDKAGILEVGTEIKAMATQTNDKGVLRVQFEGGWVSERAGNGAVCLQATAWGDAVEPPAPQEAAASQASEVVVAEEAPTATVAKQEEAAVVEEEAEAAAGAVGAHEEAPAAEEAVAAKTEEVAATEASPAEEQVAADDNEAAAVAAAAQEKPLAEEAATAEADTASLAKEQVAASEAAAVEQVVADEAPTPSGCCVYRSAKCVKKSQIRAGFDMASDKAGIISVGTVIDVIETRPNDAGTLRIHFSGGWVSEHAGNGATCFELVRNDLGAPPSFKAPEPAQLASAPEPAPEPTTVPEAPLVVSVTEEDVALGEYKCLHAAVIREGSGMDTSKAGTLDVGERIDVLETHTLETGLVRCRFKDGWVSAQLHGEAYTSRPQFRTGWLALRMW